MRVLVVVAHPDDEVIGPGGAIIRHIQQGDYVSVLILAENISSSHHEYTPPGPSDLEASEQETQRACDTLGVSRFHRENLRNVRLDSYQLLDLVKLIEKWVQTERPDVVYTHFGGDLNVDHKITYSAVVAATRPMQGCSVKWLYAFETISSTEWNFTPGISFAANYFVDISNQLDLKLNAMRQYHSQLREFPHPRSVEGITVSARRWGTHCGSQAAEAFMIIRGMWPK